MAHNPHSAAYLASQLRQIPGKGKRRAVVGMLKDKDIAQSLEPLTPLFDQWHLVSLGGARGANARQLAEQLPQGTANVVLHEDVLSAYQAVSARLQPDELLVVFGSFFTVSAVLAGHQEAK